MTMNLNRRSFLKGIGATTIILATPMTTVGDIVKPMSAMEQVKELDKLPIEDVISGKAMTVKAVQSGPFEKAFLLGFHRLEHTQRKTHIDTVKSGNQYNVRLTVGDPGDQCNAHFTATDHMSTDFEFMNRVTKDVYANTEVFFSMSKSERQMAQGARWLKT